MRIGQVAKLTGTTPKAIRHYEAIGLLDAIPRRGSYRAYSANEVAFIKLIKQAKSLGFSLREIGSLKTANGTLDWMMIDALIADKRESVTAEVARLLALDRQLASLQQELASCLASEAGTNAWIDCPTPDSALSA